MVNNLRGSEIGIFDFFLLLSLFGATCLECVHEKGTRLFVLLVSWNQVGKRTKTNHHHPWKAGLLTFLGRCVFVHGLTGVLVISLSRKAPGEMCDWKWKNIKMISKRRMGMQSFHLSNVVLATKFVSEKSYMYDWWWWFSPELRVEPPVWNWRSRLIVNAKDDKCSLSWLRWEQKWWTISEALRSTQLIANIELALIDLVDRFSLSHHKLAFVNRND